jgi:hypothetical protein
VGNAAVKPQGDANAASNYIKDKGNAYCLPTKKLGQKGKERNGMNNGKVSNYYPRRSQLRIGIIGKGDSHAKT